MRTISMALSLALLLGLAHYAAAVEVYVPAGDITVRAPNNNTPGDKSYFAGIEQTIDSSGFDEATGVHEGGGFNSGTKHWLGEGSAAPGGQAPNNEGGLNAGSIANGNVWGAWDFATPQEVVDIHLWNYGGCCGRGMNTATVEANLADGSWEKLFLGQLQDATATFWAPDDLAEGESAGDNPGELLSGITPPEGGQAWTAPSGPVSSIVFTAGDAPGGPLSDGAVYDTNHGGSGNIGLSEVRFVLVPEPATIGLLTLGGLAMLRRRRAA